MLRDNMGACLLHSFKVYLGAYPGVGALHSPCQNSYLGAYPGEGGTLPGILRYAKNNVHYSFIPGIFTHCSRYRVPILFCGNSSYLTLYHVYFIKVACR